MGGILLFDIVNDAGAVRAGHAGGASGARIREAQFNIDFAV